MNSRMLAQAIFIGVVLAGSAPVLYAQSNPSQGESRVQGGMRNNPQWQACKKQAEDKQLARGPDRRTFMQQCLKSAGGASNGNGDKPAS